MQIAVDNHNVANAFREETVRLIQRQARIDNIRAAVHDRARDAILERLNARQRRKTAVQNVYAVDVANVETARYRRVAAVENDQTVIDRVRTDKRVVDRVLLDVVADEDVRQRRDAARDDSDSVARDYASIVRVVAGNFVRKGLRRIANIDAA